MSKTSLYTAGLHGLTKTPAEMVEEVINMDTAILEAEKRKAYLSGDEKLIRESKLYATIE